MARRGVHVVQPRALLVVVEGVDGGPGESSIFMVDHISVLPQCFRKQSLIN
jgi:hypothetical protein